MNHGGAMSLINRRRKEIYEIFHPESKRGTHNQYTARRQNGEKQNNRFTKETAKSTGKSERQVQRSINRAEKLGDD
jgi:hypothetical protein